MNPLRKAVRDYLTMRRGLGFKLVRHEAGLREFVSFLARKRSTRITVNLALEWATQNTKQAVVGPGSQRVNGSPCFSSFQQCPDFVIGIEVRLSARRLVGQQTEWWNLC